MPVEALAAFAIEQAWGLALGATTGATGATVAIVASRLRTRGQEGPSDTEASEPHSKTRYMLSDRVSDGVHWYGGSWCDLLTEARYGWTAQWHDTMTLAGLLASLSGAPVLSDMPGRVRLRLVYLKGRPDRAMFIADAVSAIPGVVQVEASPHTASVLIRYDPAHYASLAGLLDWIVAG